MDTPEEDEQGKKVIEPEFPRDETIDAFRKQFYRETHGVGYEWGNKTLEEFLETNHDDLESGMILAPGRHISLYTGIPETNEVGKEILGMFSEVEPQTIEFDREDLKALSGKGLTLGGADFAPPALLQCLTILGTDTVKVYKGPSKGAPVLLANEHGEFIALAQTHIDVSFTLDDLNDLALKAIRERRLALEDPTLTRIKLSRLGDEINIKHDDIEELSIESSWGSFEYYITSPQDTLQITRESFEKIREARPDLPVNDRRRVTEIDLDQITEDIQAAWRSRDPQIEDVDGHSKCLDDIIERLQYGLGLPCSLGFYVKHFGEDPPKTFNKHRSMFTADEWGRSLLSAFKGHITSLDITRRKSWDDDELGTLTIRFVNIDLDIPDVLVKPREYKAKHLQHLRTDLHLGGDDPWYVWERKEQLMEFEAENVRA